MKQNCVLTALAVLAGLAGWLSCLRSLGRPFWRHRRGPTSNKKRNALFLQRRLRLGFCAGIINIVICIYIHIFEMAILGSEHSGNQRQLTRSLVPGSSGATLWPTKMGSDLVAYMTNWSRGPGSSRETFAGPPGDSWGSPGRPGASLGRPQEVTGALRGS